MFKSYLKNKMSEEDLQKQDLRSKEQKEVHDRLLIAKDTVGESNR